jgi:gliding motility-associated-like protein
VEQNDKIKELFSEKLGNFESAVRPELWSSIASQIGTTTTVTAVSTGVSLFTKSIIGVSVAAAIGGLAYFTWNYDNQQADKNDIEVRANKTSKKVNSTRQSAAQINKVTQRNAIDDSGALNQSIEVVSDLILPTTEGFMDVVLENKELPISYVQLAELKLPELVEEKKQENPVISVELSAENSNDLSSSSALPDKEKVTLELPNVFSPNNDGANDYLEIKSTGLTDFSLVVLDMNGKPVFQTIEPSFKWDGMNLSNEKVKDGNYLYYITARDTEGRLISKSQSLRITTQH